jgi:hypothetical protein
MPEHLIRVTSTAFECRVPAASATAAILDGPAVLGMLQGIQR